MSLIFREGSLVLFQGDSITDAGRDRNNPASLGNGYALLAAAWLLSAHPERRLRFLNRGVSGNRVCDLVARWEGDCLALKPDWVSIMIGINDTWRRFDSNSPTSAADFERDYRDILSRTRVAGARLILIEPFVLPVPPDRVQWREDLDPRIHAVRRLAREFGALLVPLDGVANAAAAGTGPAYWAGDGVHPTEAGTGLIARSWLQAVGAL